MSKDFTPKQMMLTSEFCLKGETENRFGWHNFLKMCSIEMKNVGKEPIYDYTEDDFDIMKKYYYLSFMDKFIELYREIKDTPHGLKMLEKYNKEIEEYVKNGENENCISVKWFNGKLDKNFYYNEENDKLFIKNIKEHSCRNKDLQQER